MTGEFPFGVLGFAEVTADFSASFLLLVPKGFHCVVVHARAVKTYVTHGTYGT